MTLLLNRQVKRVKLTQGVAEKLNSKEVQQLVNNVVLELQRDGHTVGKNCSLTIVMKEIRTTTLKISLTQLTRCGAIPLNG